MTFCPRSCTLRCARCHQTYICPSSPPQRSHFESARAVDWYVTHPCEVKT